MTSSDDGDAELRARVRQQEVVAELGQRALEADGLDALLEHAVGAVARTLDADFVAALELLPGGDEALLREGVGWRDGLAGERVVPVGPDTDVGVALASEDAVVVADPAAPDRPGGGLLAEHGVAAGLDAVVGSPDDPWGVLGVYTTGERAFGRHDANFVQSVTNVLASTVERERTRSELEEIYGRISDAFFALDENWRFTHLNERAHELINPDDRQLVGKEVWAAFPEAVGRKFEPKYQRAMHEQETVAFEEYYPEPLDRWFEVRAYPSRSGLSVYFRDVTERKERERQLEEVRSRYETIVDHFPNGAVALVDEDLNYITFGGTPGGDTDLTRTDIEGRPVREALPPELAAVVVPHYEAALEGETATFEDAVGDRSYQFHFVPVRDDEGDIFAALGMSQEVTERRERERELERYRAIVETVQDGVYVVDADGTFTMANEAYVEMTGYAREELVGADVTTVVDEDTAEAARDHEANLQAGEGERPVLQAEITTADGDRVPAEATFALLPGGDDDRERVAVVRDITERRERERKLERAVSDLEATNERLENFASMLAHELRNPVAIGQIYSRELPREEAPEAVEHVTAALDRIDDMIDVMLVLTRDSAEVERGDRVDLAGATRDAWESVAPADATLRVETDLTLAGDAAYVRHLLRNLLENSVKHGSGNERAAVDAESSPATTAGDRAASGATGPGDGVTVTVGRLEDGFYVADDGPGIPPGEREAVFTEGYTTASGRDGTGLGLAFVRELAERYGWEYAVTESDAGGARFEFRNVDLAPED